MVSLCLNIFQSLQGYCDSVGAIGRFYGVTEYNVPRVLIAD